MVLLADTFRAPGARVSKVIVAIDLKNSTSMKEQQPEVHWLPTYGWFFDLLGTTVEKHKGKIVKFLGDGAMAVFSDDNAADGINWAIEVQEGIADAQDKRTAICDCSVGIAQGEVVEFETPEGLKDYIGSVVDKAFRLCSAANAKAIFVDTDTISAAAMNKVQSRLGMTTPRRKASDYQGLEESVTVKGFSRPVAYHEIFWGGTRYGVSPPFVTKLSSQHQLTVSRVPGGTGVPHRPETEAAGWLRGHVTKLDERFGFIRSDAGEDFWFNSGQLFRAALPVKYGEDVWFSPLPALTGAKSRRAVDVLPVGATLDGRIEKVKEEGYGFVAVSNDRGQVREIFVDLGAAGAWSPGMEVTFTLGENRKGIAGRDLRVRAI